MANKKYTSSQRQESDERVERSKRAVLATTHELLAKSGFGGVSVDEVCRRSGVAKTTIYRHWTSREDLLMEACSQLSSKPAAPDTGSTKRDLETLALMVVRRIREPWSTVLPSVIDAAERDKGLAQVQSSIHAKMRSAFVEVVERGRQRGEIPRTRDTREVVAEILGPLFYRRWFSRESIDEAFARRIVERAMT